MASLAPPPSTTTRKTFSSSSTYSTSFSFKSSQIPISRNQKNRHAISCKTLDNNNNDHQDNSNKVDRRNMLLGLGGLYGAAATMGSNSIAFANPIMAPDVTKCGAADLPQGAQPMSCCPPTASKIIDFKLPPSGPTRVRPAAHLVDKDYIAKFNKAIELMKALPDDDPRSFKQQAAVHCAYCDGAYDQVGFPDLELQVHGSWLFLPFHRYYLYFFEKICGKLIGDPNFAMPFWNWDSPDGMTIPKIYADKKSALFDSFRDAKHQPPSIIDLDFNGVNENLSKSKQVSTNLTIMYRQVVSTAKTASLFMGSPYRAGEEPSGGGSLESLPHGPVHIWTGDSTQPNGEDMGNFYSAARDPIFYAHHSNIDRLWSVWKTLGGRRNDFADNDWLDASFLFYNENAEMVRVKVRDCVDSKNLGYVYQDVATQWIESKPTPRVKRVLSKIKKLGSARADEVHHRFAKDVFPTNLDKPIKVLVKRPKKSRSKKQKDEEEEILVIEGIEVKRDAFVKFDVFVNDEDEGTSATADKTEFAGSFVNVPHKHKHGKNVKTKLRLGISELMDDLDAEDDENVFVTLVPRNGGDDVFIKGIKIELED
ncbi:polyphenol oxidase, chloroplastic-like [Rutidosis leptorrhynchoides]|uniref:polyphenol oxidase, chloroplastic-like n=1 Tax=Rutidosis leptorrhynchoides TaxID=125765 RepID=UPI003A99FDC6